MAGLRTRLLALPKAELAARRAPTTVVRLGRPATSSVVVPVLVGCDGLLFLALSHHAGWRFLWSIVALAGFGAAVLRIKQRTALGDAGIIANGLRLVFSPTGGTHQRSTPLPVRDADAVLDLYWRQVLAASLAPTSAPWWAVTRARVHLDLYLTDVAGDLLDSAGHLVVDDVPPAPDLPSRRLRFTIPRFSQQDATNMLRWYIPEGLIDPATGGSALQLEPDGDPWPDRPAETPGTLAVPIPPGPILGLPHVAVPVTEWAPPTPPMSVDSPGALRRPDFLPPIEPSDPTGPTDPGGVDAGCPGERVSAATSDQAAVGADLRETRPGQRSRPGLAGGVAVRAFRRRARAVVALRPHVGRRTRRRPHGHLSGGRPHHRHDRRDGAADPLHVATVAVAARRHGVRRLHAGRRAGGRRSGLRLDSLAGHPAGDVALPGRRTWLCLAVDAHVPADISWAVLQGSPAEQVVPGCTVLELRMPVGEAPAEDIGTGLDLGGSVPFDPVRWPDRSRA